ncbi:MAG: DUF192 domain-containing protein [Roseiflexaceae bacterium]|nr:DUF192 domain-containing protein [Roseiflexus sp.]MDW8212501.1 DUF192 domain-containing protein [Roseiflexaceae bacterium]
MSRWLVCAINALLLILTLFAPAGCSQAPAGNPAVVATTAPSPASNTSYPALTGAPTASEAYPAPGATYPAPPGAGTIEPEATVVPDAVIEVFIGKHRLEAEVVATPEKRSIGLMFREALPEDRGMLFVFAGPYTGTFWMRNTRIPLSIAFISQERRILNIEDMQPFDEVTQHAPRGAAFYALEVNQGWFAARGIRPGDEVVFELPPGLVIR